MTSTKLSHNRLDSPFRSFFIIALSSWTLMTAAIFIWDHFDRRDFLTANALSSAKATFAKDLAFRRWAAKHGGVYVPQTAETPANPYLNTLERDIVTPSGRALTLMNPAYMTRQVYEEVSRSEKDAPLGHITSLKPLRPENAPDSWEKQALEAFEKGSLEVNEFQTIGGAPYFRYMRPLIAEKSCLNCHSHQGYHEGDIRGGISVAIPVTAMMSAARHSSIHHTVIILLIWLTGSVGLWYGIHRVNRSSRALRESEERYRQQFEQCRAVTLIIDPINGAIVDANPAACDYYGYTGQQIRTMNITEISLNTPEERATCIKGILDGCRRQFTVQHRLADGLIRVLEVFANPVEYSSRTLLYSICIDITARLVAEQQVRDKMDFAESLLLNSSTPTFVINAEHKVQIWNRAIEELTGIKAAEIIGTSKQWQVFYETPRSCLADIVLDGRYDESNTLYAHLSRSRLTPDGLNAEGDYTFADRHCRLVFSAAPIRDRNGKVIAAIETLEDITERISLESQLVHAQKMESVGILSGGIAHDFNNILTVINGYADLLKMTLTHNEESLHYACEIASSVNRAADMTRSLLAFSGKHEISLQYDDLNIILSALRKSLGRLIREDIALTVQTQDTPLPVFVDRVQIEQILMNLVINARDAIGSNGTITISTSTVHIETALQEGATTIPPGKYARLSVADNGSGISDAALEHIFEPFFTTKEKGKGTGLGLAIVQSIVAKHNGSISICSTPEQGSEFHIYLPAYEGRKKTEITTIIAPDTNYRGNETILVVEDDVAIMKLLNEILCRFGYKIFQAADGIEALELFSAHRDEIQLIIIDVIMPRMNGRDTVEEIRKLSPSLPVIMTSGYTDDIVDRQAIEKLSVTFLQKPLKPLELLAAVGHCMKTPQEQA
jgi:PAS domain S-box-containing protein